MEKKMKTTMIMRYTGTTIRIQYFTSSKPKVSRESLGKSFFSKLKGFRIEGWKC